MEKGKIIVISLLKILAIIALIFVIIKNMQVMGLIEASKQEEVIQNKEEVTQESDKDSNTKFWENAAQWFSPKARTMPLTPVIILNIGINSLAIVVLILSFTKKKIQNKAILWTITALVIISLLVPVEYIHSFYQYNNIEDIVWKPIVLRLFE